MTDRRFGYQTTTVTTKTGVEDLSDDELAKFNRLIVSETQRRGLGGRGVVETIEVPPPNILSPTVVSPTREFVEPLNNGERVLLSEDEHDTGYTVRYWKEIVPKQAKVIRREYEDATVIDPPPQVVRTRTSTVLPVQQQYVVATPTVSTVPVYTTPVVTTPTNQVTTTTRRTIFPNGM